MARIIPASQSNYHQCFTMIIAWPDRSFVIHGRRKQKHIQIKKNREDLFVGHRISMNEENNPICIVHIQPYWTRRPGSASTRIHTSITTIVITCSMLKCVQFLSFLFGAALNYHHKTLGYIYAMLFLLYVYFFFFLYCRIFMIMSQRSLLSLLLFYCAAKCIFWKPLLLLLLDAFLTVHRRKFSFIHNFIALCWHLRLTCTYIWYAIINIIIIERSRAKWAVQVNLECRFPNDHMFMLFINNIIVIIISKYHIICYFSCVPFAQPMYVEYKYICDA